MFITNGIFFSNRLTSTFFFTLGCSSASTKERRRSTTGGGGGGELHTAARTETPPNPLSVHLTNQRCQHTREVKEHYRRRRRRRRRVAHRGTSQSTLRTSDQPALLPVMMTDRWIPPTPSLIRLTIRRLTLSVWSPYNITDRRPYDAGECTK